MRKLLIAVFGLTALLIALGPASARTITLERVSRISLIGSCAAAGGDYTSSGGHYWCSRSNCDGKGGTCYVVCSDTGSCVGSTPRNFRVELGEGELDFEPRTPSRSGIIRDDQDEPMRGGHDNPCAEC